MKAAVLRTLGKPPRLEEFPDPEPSQGEVIVRVKAASLKNIDRMLANGSHYDRHPELPVVCGTDGVGLLEDGTRVFCGGARHPYGMFAERSVVSRAWCLPVPDDLDDVTAAALPNPALSSWLPLVWRAQLQRGETVLILGATGVAGKLAVQIARHLGAGRVVAAGRNEQILKTLNSLGADATIQLDLPDNEVAEAFRREISYQRFDVVLDYLWAHPTEVLLDALTGHDLKAQTTRTRLVDVGEMAGPRINLAAAALRSSGLELYGSGGGSIQPKAILDTFPQLWALAAGGKLHIDTQQAALADIDALWQRQNSPGRRLVIVP